MAAPTYSTTTPKITDRDLLTDFERLDLELLGQTKRVFVGGGAGPAVIVMAEMPGIYSCPAPRCGRTAW